MNRLFPETPEGAPLKPRVPKCAKCGDDCERLTPQLPEGISTGEMYVYYAGLCRLHSELEFSQRWMRRLAAAQGDEGRRAALMRERSQWEHRGHVFRGVGDGGAYRERAA